jgi:hypothetical protein
MEAASNPTGPPAAPAPRQAFEKMKPQEFKDYADVNNKVLLDVGGRNFCISLKTVEDPRQYIIMVDDVEVLHVPRVRNIIANSTVDRVVKYIAKKVCEGEGKAIKPCLAGTAEQTRAHIREALVVLYKRIVVKKPEIPTGDKVAYARPPYFYVEDAGVACALTFELATGERGIKYIPYFICIDKNKNVTTHRLLDVVQAGIRINGVLVFPSSVALKKIIMQAESVDELEEMLSSWMEGGISLVAISGVPAVPIRHRLEKYINIVKKDPEGWAKGVARFIKDKIFERTWRLLSSSQKAVMVGTVLAASVFPMLPYTTKVVFHSAGPGAGKSYHIGITASFIPYNLVISAGTSAGIERSVDFAVAVSIDDIPQKEDARRELADLLIRGFKKDSKRVLTSPDGISPIAIGGGPIIFIPDIAYQLLGISDAATSRTITIAVAADPKFVEIKEPEEVVVREILRGAKIINTNSGEVLVLYDAEDWYVIFTAVGLMMCWKFAEELERLRAELKEKPKVVGRYAQAYGAIIAALRAYGLSDLADKVMTSLESRERRDETLEALAAAVSGLWEDAILGKMPGEIYIRKESFADGSPVVFAPMTSMIRYAAFRLAAAYGDVPQVTDRVKLEESANASFKTIEHWMRRAIPRELQNDKNLLAYLQGHPALRQLLFKTKNQHGNVVWGIAVTESIVKTLINLATTDDIETAVVSFCTVRRRICDEVDLPQKEYICKHSECDEVLQQPPAVSPPQQSGQQHEQQPVVQVQQDENLPSSPAVEKLSKEEVLKMAKELIGGDDRS